MIMLRLLITALFCAHLCTGNVKQYGLTAKNGISYGLKSIDLDPFVDLENIPNMIQINMDTLAAAVYDGSLWENYIIVFPEHSVSSVHVLQDRDLIREFAQEIPDVGVIACQTFDPLNQTQHITYRFSCFAATHSTYIVANILEVCDCEEGLKFFSTAVAFDRNGTLIAKYRKPHLCDKESGLDAGDIQAVTFTTDFGVQFGILISTDIMFEQPATELFNKGITEFVIPFSWTGKLPFLAPLQMQYGWYASMSASTNPFNSIFACYQSPSEGYTGCGQFTTSVAVIGFERLECQPFLACTFSTSFNTTANSRQIQGDFVEANKNNFFHDKYDLSNFTSDLLVKNTAQNQLETCNNGLCCTLSYHFISLDPSSHYQFLVYNGPSAGNTSIQVCGLVACADDSVESCAVESLDYVDNTSFSSLEITASSFNTSLVMPILMRSDFLLISARLTKNDQIINLQGSHSLSSILTFALHSHNLK